MAQALRAFNRVWATPAGIEGDDTGPDHLEQFAERLCYQELAARLERGVSRQAKREAYARRVSRRSDGHAH